MLSIYTILFISSIGLVWKNILRDFPKLDKRLHAIPLAGHAIACSFCFIYWLSLAVLLINEHNLALSQIFVRWMVTGIETWAVYVVMRILFFCMEILYQKLETTKTH